MKRGTVLTHEFVDFIPGELKDGTIYVSVAYATAAHKCCCGCGREVVTPLSPTDWKLIFDGESVSLEPSIGSWNFPCQSHYWIERNRVRWARRWSEKEIKAGRERDSLAKERYYGGAETSDDGDTITIVGGPEESNPRENFWWRLRKLLF
jgi:Family of unknown function (DUF6527)